MSSDREPLILRKHKHFDSYEVDLAESKTLLRRVMRGAEGITCPVQGCGCECVHPTSVDVNAGGSITTVDHAGTRMSSGDASGRGVRIHLGFACEWGHDFSLVFQFHKGSTGIEVLDDGSNEDARGVPTFETLWRD
jgi:hypothetical protein